MQGHDEIVWAVEVAGNRLLSASADKTIRMWDIDSRRCEHVLEDHARPVLSLSVCGNKLFSGSYDYTIKVWSLETLQRLKTLTGTFLYRFAPPCKVLAGHHGHGGGSSEENGHRRRRCGKQTLSGNLQYLLISVGFRLLMYG